ncbi:replication protein A 70 kDa dna-binding subunit [Trifolium medium]|uniref:Replication protein A 70 kDa dna-binding subunit n=1 Tax=Trifolium medium TaxID=97028 RepID=A0A392LY47_9FABA|nr:replication protein A 70 kDa dna-binding subunit [Trifolium medium]
MALTIANANHFSNIEEINSEKATWSFKAKIIRLWKVSDFNRNNNPFSMEMVLMDSEGGKIHATIKKTLIYKFKDDLIEGKVYSFENLGVSINGGSYRTTHHPYKLNFQFGSLVQRLTNYKVEASPFNFVPISDVVGGCYDTDFLVDVIGVLTGVGSEREITNGNGTTTKLNVIALEAEGHKLQCTLFGPYVDELNTFIASGDHNNAVVIVQLAKAKTFQVIDMAFVDKIHIQNCMNCSKLIFNPVCRESTILRESLPESLESPSPMTLTQIHAESSVRPVDEFLFNTPRMTLQGLKDATTESLNVVCATVKRILNPDCFWYTACVCNKSVIPDSNMFFCEKCNKHVLKVFPRYCMKVRVMDDTDSATFVIFDKDASSLFNMSCADMLGATQKNGGVGVVPPQMASLVDKTWLFKVETKPSSNPRFEQTFRVRKICTDNAIIKQFKDKWDNEEASLSKTANEVGSLSTLLDKGKDVLVCSSTNILSEDLLSLSGSCGKGKGKEIDIESTPVGVTEDLMKKFSSAVVDLGDDSEGTFTQEIEKSLISSKDLHALAGSSSKYKAKEMVLEATQVGETHEVMKKTKSDVVNVADYAIESEKSVITYKEGKPSDMVLHGTPVGQRKNCEKMIASGGINLADGSVESEKAFTSPNQVKADDYHGVKPKKGGKRLSPQQEDEDDNAPIKLLKRAIKIEKIA